MVSRERKYLWLCVAFILVAALLRIAFVSSEALWGDEVFTLRFVSGSFGEVLGKTVHDVHPPLYFLLMRGWVGVAGTSAAALRAPSVLFGLAALAVFYLLCRRLQLPALPGTALFALSLSGLVYSHEARSYTLLLLLALSMWLFLAGIIARQRGYALYSLSAALLLYTHVEGLLAFALTVAFAVFSFPRKVFLEKRFIAATAAPVLLFAPWLPAFFIQIRDFLPLLLERLALNTGGRVTPSLFWAAFGAAALFGAVLLAWKVWRGDGFSLLRWYRQLAEMIRLHLWPFLAAWAALLIAAYSLFAATNPFVRYSLFLLPVVYLFVAGTVARRKAAAVVLMLFSLSLLIVNVTSVDRFDWKHAVPYALSFHSGDTLYGLERAGTSHFLFAYYARGQVPDIERFMLRLRVANLEGPDTFYPAGQLEPGKRYVLVLSKLKGEPSFYEPYLRTTHTLLAEKDFADVRVVVFEPRASPSAG